MTTGSEIIQIVTNADLRNKLEDNLEEFKQTKHYKDIETQLTTFANNNSLDPEAATILALLGYAQELQLQLHETQKIAFLLGFQKHVDEGSPIKTLSESELLDRNLLGFIMSYARSNEDQKNLAEGFDAREILKELDYYLNYRALSLWLQLCYPTAQDKDGYTALICAAMCGDTETVKTLLAAGANVNTQDKDGNTALIWAARYGKTETVRVLLDCKQVDVNETDNTGRTALMLAANNGKTKTVRVLLDCKQVDVNAQNEDGGRTALICAAKHGHTEIVETLLAKGANVNTQDKYGNTALIWAAKHGHTEIVETLLAKGANVNAQNKDGDTALILAAYSVHTETVRVLLDCKQVDVNETDNTGRTALMLAACIMHTETVKTLLAKGANVNAKDEDGYTALMLAARYGKTETVRVLLDCKQVDVNETDNTGRTALMLAAENGHTEIAKIIQEAQEFREHKKNMQTVHNELLLSFSSLSALSNQHGTNIQECDVPNITCCGIRTNWKSAAIAAVAAVAVGAAVGMWSLSQASSHEIGSYAIDL